MQSWPSKLPTLVAGLISVASIAYPFAYYLTRNLISPLVFVGIAILLVVARLATLKGSQAKIWQLPMLVVAILLGALTLLDRPLAAQAYPVLLSLTAAYLFSWSLFKPPSFIETFARVRTPNLSLEAKTYCRTVTIIWAIWFFANACIAAALAKWGSLEAWTIWTGAIFYVVTALLIVGEIGFRRYILEIKDDR